jgi:hypothetical protein
MASYRLHCLDGAGHIALAEWLEAEDDTQAIALARELKDGALECEVWLGKRLVASLTQQSAAGRGLGAISQASSSRRRGGTPRPTPKYAS